VGLLWILITGGDGGGVVREKKESKGCFCSVTILLVLPMKPVSSFHTGEEIGARGEGCDETTTQTTRASHPHHLSGISTIFQRLLFYFPGLLQRYSAEGGLQRCLREEKKLGVYSLLWRDTPFALRRFQCGMVAANSTGGICQVDG